MFQRTSLVAWILALAIAGIAQAGPMPDWRGFYLGVFAGQEWNSLKYWEPDYSGFERDPDLDGGMRGFLAGYNIQQADRVFGIELDRGFGKFSAAPDYYAKNNYSAFETSWTAHIRGRFGYVYGPVMVYTAAGLCFVRVKVIDTDPGWGRDEATHVGWGGGVGVDYALARHAWLRAEYLYDDFGSKDYTISGPVPYRATVSLTGNTVRAALMVSF